MLLNVGAGLAALLVSVVVGHVDVEDVPIRRGLLFLVINLNNWLGSLREVVVCSTHAWMVKGPHRTDCRVVTVLTWHSRSVGVLIGTDEG